MGVNEEKKQQFDAAATAYDAVFTFSEIGKLQRERVYYWLRRTDFFKTPRKVFEINCGTGYDAELMHKQGHEVIATDLSSKMIAVAKSSRDKAIDFFPLDFSEVHREDKFKAANVLFSNFGGLNCLSEAEINHFIQNVGQVQQKGDKLIMVIMAKKCLMEDLYHLLTFRWKKIGRRANPKGLTVNVDGEQVKTYYHSPKQLKKALNEHYKQSFIRPVAFFLPPSYLENLFKKAKPLLKLLYFLETQIANQHFLSAWADHYIIISEKKA